MKTLLICHEESRLTREGLARWLANFSDLAGIVSLDETKQRVYKRIRREIARVGIVRFVDVLAFRAYYRAFLARADDAWMQRAFDELLARYPPVPKSTAVLPTHSPNSPEAEQFIKQVKPDIILARCKTLLRKEIFTIPTKGTFVMHPGICPEYRNAHGCFWALANNDLNRVGMTLLRIDEGVDTGPVYGYFTCPFDERKESHLVIQQRVVLDNLKALEQKFHEINDGTARTMDTSGRKSATWGQPWLSAYLRWKLNARRRARC